MVCRVCLKESECVLQIFGEEGMEKQISEILQKHLWFNPLPDDPISSVVCNTCWCKINDFHNFYETVELAHKLYYELYNFDSAGKTTLDIDNAVELAETLYNVKNEDNAYSNEKDESPRTAVNPLYEPELPEDVIVKAEIPEIETGSLDNIDNSMHFEERREEFLTESSSDEDMSSNGSIFEPEEPSTPSPTTSNDVKTRKRSREASTSGSKTTKMKTKKKRSKIGKNPITTKTSIKTGGKTKHEKRCWTKPLDDEMVRKHLPLNCELCGFNVDTFTEMITHFRATHKDTRPYIFCCGRRLSKRQRVVQHAYHHEDPNYFQCEICKRSFSDNYVLRSHMLAHHPAEDELTHQCDQCDKRFSRRYLLELHKPVHIPVEERKFMCTKCPTPKAFASDHLRQIHDNMRHKRATNVCHVCAKEIRDNQAFEKHVRLHFEDSGPRVKCPRPGCDRWLKDDDNLKQHLRRHNDEGKVITCELCGKSVKNRRALSSHMSYAHSKALFTCEECKKTFKKAITLKEHMAQHTGETLYKCPFCPRTFNSNANMHSHKKKMHPIEWDIWRKTKTGSSQHTKSNAQVQKTMQEMVASSMLQNMPQTGTEAQNRKSAMLLNANSMLQNMPETIVNIERQDEKPEMFLQVSDGNLL